MSGLVRMAALLIVGASMLGCSVRPSGSSVEPTMGASPTPSSASPTLPFPQPSTVGLQIDARRVISTAGIQCSGGPLGGEGDDTTSYEVWTLHCPAGSGADNGPAKLVAALKAEVERLGATIQDEGNVTSDNAGNKGDEQTTLHYRFEAVEIRIRVTFLKEGDGSSMVVTIDQRRL
jgi:hypothetical protein